MIFTSCVTDVNTNSTEENQQKNTTVYNARSAATATSDGSAIVALAWNNPTDAYYGTIVKCTPAGGTLLQPQKLESNVTTFIVQGLKADTEYIFTWINLDSTGNETSLMQMLPVKTPECGTTEYTQEELKELLDTTSKSSIYEEILSGKTAAELFEKLSTEQKTALFDKMAEDTTFLSRLNQTQIDEIANDASDTKKAEIFDELLLSNTNVEFIKEILNKSGNETIRKSVKDYLVAELTQEELQALLDGTDTTAPDNVTNLVALNLGNAVKLTWTDATNEDILAYEITFSTPSLSRSISFESNSIVIPQGVGKAFINELANDYTYSFTVKTVDRIGNKSSGETISCLVRTPAFTINFTPEVIVKTNQNYSISVDFSSTDITNIYYMKGNISSIDTFFDNISKNDISTTRKFVVSENSDYTVGAIDTKGNREIKIITISNIDTIAPANVTNIVAKYSSVNKKITLAWTEPTDTDFAKVEFTYSKADGSETVVEKLKGTTSLEFTEIDATNEVYSFSVASVDNVGNKSVPQNISITTLTGPAVTSIVVDNAHLSGNQTERTVNVTVNGSNFDKIAEQTDKSFKVQVVTSSGTVTNYDATVNASENTATAAVTIPEVTGATASGTSYTIRAKVCGVIDTDHTAKVNVSSDWKINSITLDTTQISVNDVTADSKVHITVKGTTLDLAKNIAIKLFDSTGTEYTQSATSVSTPTELHATTFEADVKIPLTDDFYTVKITASETISSSTTTLQVYGAPEFASFVIPPAGTSKEDNIVTATVTGKNFTAPSVFSVSCATTSITNGSSVTIKDDRTLTVTLTIPGSASSYDVTITNGTSSATGTFVVKDYSSVEVGDIIYTDGTKSSKDAELVVGKIPAAVVAGFNTNGIMLGLGLKQNSSELQWASGRTGYNTNFIGIIAYSNKTGQGAASNATITGDTIGSDNWEYVKSNDPEGTADAATYYPAFNFAANYAATAGFTGEIAEGWYMPSIAELCELYKNKDILNTSLSKCRGTQFRENYYWSSSQVYNFACGTWSLDFSDGYLTDGGDRTYSYYYVCCIRAF